MADDPTSTDPLGAQGAPGGDVDPPAQGGDDRSRPWTRRRFLGAVAAVGGTAAMGAVVWSALHDEEDDEPGQKRAEPTLDAAAPQTETRTLQFTLGHAAGVEGLTLHVAGVRYPLVPHTDETRAAFVSSDPVLAGLDAGMLTHYAESVSLPPVVLQMPVLQLPPGQKYIDDKTVYHASIIHVPTAGMAAAWQRRSNLQAAVRGIEVDPQYRQLVSDATVRKVDAGQLRKATQALAASGAGGLVGGNAGRWARLGFTEGNAPQTPEQAQVLLQVTDDAMSSAVSLVLKHPDIATYDVTGAGTIVDVMHHVSEVQTLAATIDEMYDRDAGASLGTFVQTVDADGKPATLPPGIQASDGELPQVPVPTLQISPTLLPGVGAAANTVVTIIKNHPDLQGLSWQPQTSQVPATVAPASGLEAAGTIRLDGTCTTSASHGLKVVAADPQPQDGNVHVVLSNDFLRHVMVGVGFYDRQGHGIDISGANYGAPSPYPLLGKDPFVRPLFIMPSAPTIVGVTRPGANSQELVLTFPTGAVEARLYLLSLGLDLIVADAQRYMVDAAGRPAYGSSLGVPIFWYSSLLTLVLDLGVPALLLLSAARDLSNVNTQVYKQIFNGGGMAAEEIAGEFEAIATNIRTYFAAAGVAAAVVTGAAVTVDQLKGLDIGQTFWRLIKDIGVDLLRVLGNGKIAKLIWKAVMTDIATSEAMDAIPFLGEALAAISAFENAAKLATSSVEIASSPTMITAHVTNSLTAAVTLAPTTKSIDDAPPSKYLPRTATKLDLQFQFQGTPLQSHVVQDVSLADGKTSLSVNVPNMPVRGDIQWTATFLDGSGQRVGYGTTTWLPVNGPDSAGAKPQIEIQQTTIAIGPDTRFARAWTSEVVGGKAGPTGKGDVPGTVDDLVCGNGDTLCETDGITVSTQQGVAGYAWSAAGRWWVRNLATGTDMADAWNSAGPYPRRALVAYDPLTADPTAALNFVLEPWEDEGYLVYRVSVAGAAQAPGMGIDRSKPVGRFDLLLNDVTYCPTGHLVGVSARSGRLAVLEVGTGGVDPVAAPRAQLHAGTGQREGLLNLPVAVTSTKKGHIIVLDGGESPALRAFAVDGNPVPIFAGDTSSIALPTDGGARVHVGVAADGADYLYVLSYEDELDASSWILDVYDHTGAKQSSAPNVNAGRLAVDYWQSVFTLNYDPLRDDAGAVVLDPGTKVAEPSMSAWEPAKAGG